MGLITMYTNKDTNDRIPKEFDTTEMENDLIFGKRRFTNVIILKWKIEEDDRPLYVKNAIILANYAGKHALANILKHPRRQHPPPRWTPHEIVLKLRTGLELYNDTPTREDLHQYEKHIRWNDLQWSDLLGFRLIDSGICHNNINKYLRK